MLATSDGTIQHHTTLDNGDQSIHDAYFFLPRILGPKTSPQAYARVPIKIQHELNEMCRKNPAQVQMRRRKRYDGKILQAEPTLWDNMSGCFRIPPKVTKKLLKKWT